MQIDEKTHSRYRGTRRGKSHRTLLAAAVAAGLAALLASSALPRPGACSAVVLRGEADLVQSPNNVAPVGAGGRDAVGPALQPRAPKTTTSRKASAKRRTTTRRRTTMKRQTTTKRRTSSRRRATTTAPRPTPLYIAMSMASPVSGTVELSVLPEVQGHVTWFVDGRSLGRGADRFGHPASWDTARSGDGVRAILARIRLPNGSTRDLRRSATVSNVPFSLNISVETGENGGWGGYYINLTVSAVAGVSRVDAKLDGRTVLAGVPAGLPRRHNSRILVEGHFDYSDHSGNDGLGGNHTLTVLVKDKGSRQRTGVFNYVIHRAPFVEFTSGPLGAMASGEIRLAGVAFALNRGARLQLRATTKEGRELPLSISGRTFVCAFSTATFRPGFSSIIMSASDSFGDRGVYDASFFVASSPALAYTPLALPNLFQPVLFTARGNRLVLSASLGPNPPYLLSLDTSTGTSRIVTSMLGADFSDWTWALAEQGNGAYILRSVPACTLGKCLYGWDDQIWAQTVNLSADQPWINASAGVAGATEGKPVARAGYVLWANLWNTSCGYALYNSATRSYVRIPCPVGMQPPVSGAESSYDFFVNGSEVHVYFGLQAQQAFHVFHWSSATNLTTKVSTDAGGRNPRTDGSRVVWADAGSRSLLSMAAPESSPAVIASIAGSSFIFDYSVADGVLAWSMEDQDGAAISLMASVNGSTAVSVAASGKVEQVAGGAVLYSTADKFWIWRQGQGSKAVLDRDEERQKPVVWWTGSRLVFQIYPYGGVYSFSV
ncbi:hypothetical protein DFJ74DRAFT_770766 [Hyaloraphidium curvatum]|nr:hypothetical protein DFJ74DRAFT_770766 [Hyaloraphidium curvatum]